MSYIGDREFYLEVRKGNVAGHTIIQKFGSNESLTTSWQVATTHGTYETPTTAQSLEIVSDDAADALNGIGMHEITIEGLDANWEHQSVQVTAHATDGTIAVAVTGTWMRVYMAFVSSSGTYATPGAGSHVGTIDIQISGGGTIYSQVSLIDGFPSGQSEMGAYTVPSGKTAYILSKAMTAESNKPMDVNLFKRENANDTTSSYSGIMRLVEHIHGLESSFQYQPLSPLVKLPEMTDVGFMVKMTTGTGSISVDFEILLVDN